ncbi:hypothetical protein HS7_11460 [Sulfolobales archaeon HS-7]|nr:hypothetical protein HS7_11460 [Sulfolobales archaeon HS-7]
MWTKVREGVGENGRGANLFPSYLMKFNDTQRVIEAKYLH